MRERVCVLSMCACLVCVWCVYHVPSISHARCCDLTLLPCYCVPSLHRLDSHRGQSAKLCQVPATQRQPRNGRTLSHSLSRRCAGSVQGGSTVFLCLVLLRVYCTVLLRVGVVVTCFVGPNGVLFLLLAVRKLRARALTPPNLQDVTPTQAKQDYLRRVHRLPLYGSEFFDVWIFTVYHWIVCMHVCSLAGPTEALTSWCDAPSPSHIS
jgi:hypothetical protein